MTLRQPEPAPLQLQTLGVGTRLSLRDGATVEIVSNPGDGIWVFVRYLSSDEAPSKVGTEDMVFRGDVAAVLGS